MGTGNIGIVGREAVDQPLRKQKIQRTVDRGWRRRPPGSTQLVEQLVGANRLPCPAYQLQHLPAQLGETQIPPIAQAFGLVEKNTHLLGRWQGAAGCIRV